MSTAELERIERLSPAKRALLHKLLQAQEAEREHGIPVRPTKGPAPLSYAQERLWFLERMQPGHGTLNMPLALRLHGRLQVSVLAASLREVMRRHEVLRSRVVSSEREPRQEVLPLCDLLLPVVDLRGLSPSGREAQTRRLAQSEAEIGFDLAAGPLLRARVALISDREQVFLLTLHHLACDGWSMGILVGEIVSLYESCAQGLPSVLAAPPLQYADYACWQRAGGRSETFATQLEYWREVLAGAPDRLDLPTDFASAGAGSFRGSHCKLILGSATAQRLRALVRAAQATPFMALLGVFAALLARLSGQQDLIVGAPVADRGRRELERVMGCFLNTLALRADLSGRPTFRELLRRMREVTLGALANQDVPFEKVLAEVRPHRGSGRLPWLRAFFNMLSYPAKEIRLPDLVADPPLLPEIPSKFDLTLYVAERDDTFHFTLVWSAELFAAPRMRELLLQYETLLVQCLELSEVEIDRHSLVTAGSRGLLPDPKQDLLAGNEGPMHAGFLAQARRSPGSLAVAEARRAFTYGDLDLSSRRLAAALRMAGLEQGDRVAIFGPRSTALVCALLGVLRAGGAFVLLDPAYPATRLATCAALAQPRACIEIGSAELPVELTARLAEIPARLRLRLAHDLELAPGAAAEAVEDWEPAGPDDLAYLAFTSGSTGSPKAIMGTHRPVSHFLAWYAQHFGLGDGDRFSMLSGLSHDPLLRDVFAPLSLGAVLLVPEPGVLADSRRLIAWLAEQGASVIHLTPALGRMLAEGALGDARARIRSLRYAFFGGDVLTAGDLARFATLAPAARCVNFYGTTETPQAMGVYEPRRPDDLAATPGQGLRIPVGAGIDGAQLLVLNETDGLAGVGELGEICIRTPYLARGYLAGEPAERGFTFNPFTARPGDRMYRTGDLGRYRWDGCVELVGRADDQVKVRGFRLELVEVEAALAQHPDLAAAAVVRHEDAAGAPFLAAYVVPRQGAVPIRELRAFLRARLPEFMVPEAWVALERLPLTPNGKLDRRALPPPVAAGTQVPARRALTGTEEMLAAIWSEVLGAEPSGPEDDFFDLGGHSLKAAQVEARVRQRFGVDLPLAAFFEAPTLGGLAARLDARLGAGASGPRPTLNRLPREGDLELSFAQQRLWFLAQLEPSSSSYNIPSALRLRGPLDAAALARSLAALLDRHEVLRTRIVSSDGIARARIARAELPLPVVDLTTIPESRRSAVVELLVHEETARPFDLSAVPWVRACLLRLEPEEHFLVLTLHHVVADGWSIGILVRDVAAFYQAYSTRQTPRLPALPYQYADFAHWQRVWMRGEILEAQLTYWRTRLAGAPGVLELPFAQPRRRRPGGNPGRRRHFRIDTERRAALSALGRKEGVTLFMTLLATFEVLLARYTGQSDFVVGTPIANRTRPEIEDLIGCFVNALALRADLHGDPRFAELLARVRDVALGAFAHQDVPFELLVDALQPERSLHHTPLFQIVFALQNAPLPALSVAGLELAPVELATRAAKFDLIVMMQESQGGLLAVFEYDSDLFEQAAVARMQGHLEALLAGVTADPAQRLADLPLLSAAERHQALCEWNDTMRPGCGGVTLVHLVEAAARRSPDRVAVLCGDRSLSFGELERQAERLARGLAHLGAGRGAYVAIWMERSLEMVPGLLGILKAGAAYVPLEASYPKARVEWILKTLDIRHLVTERSRLAAAALDPAVPYRICLDAPGANERGVYGLDRFAELPALPLDQAPAADDLAYVIFTSGSTGQPKGAALCHAPVVNLIEWVNRSFAVGPADRVLLMASLCFDLSVYDIFGLLAAGGSVRVIGEPEVRDPERLLRRLHEEPITFWDSAPAALQQLAPLLAPDPPHVPPAALRLVFLSGDWVPVKLPDLMRAHFPSARVISLGGATEAAIWSNFYPVEVVDPRWPSIPYGRPIQNARYHVLEAGLAPAPIGVPGDLYIGGPVLSAGYAAEPALTAASFLPDPFAVRPGERLYRTGDRARHWADGTIEFRGRADHQVKIRGFRIELGEIEATLLRHQGVQAAVAVVREDEPGMRRLVAYYVTRPGAAVGSEELRVSLQESLPVYMVPNALVALEALPVTANGKLDRRALPAPTAVRPGDERGYVAPRDSIERTLAAIWREVLRIDKVGVQDNFFELGGESILSLQVVSRAARAGLKVTSAQIFRFQTIAELRAVVEESPQLAEEEAAAGPVALTPIQHWFFEHELADPGHFNQSVLLELRQTVAPHLLAAAILGLVRDHQALRLRFRRVGESWVQLGVAVEPHRVFAVCDLSFLPPGRRLAALEAAADETQASLDIERGPLLRTVFFRLDDSGASRLLLVIHHLAVDGVSWRILLEDLHAAVAQLSKGEEPAPSLRTTSFLRFADRLQEYARSAAPGRELDYWRALSRRSFATLPADHPHGSNRVASSRSLVLSFAAEETRALLHDLARAYRIQINEVLLAALAEAWAAITGEDRLRVDLEGHGREPWLADTDLSRTVGWFTTVAPLVLDIAGCAGPADLLKRVKEQVRNLPSRGFNYGVLRYLAPAADGADLRALPPAQVSFNYLGQFDQVFPASALFAPAKESSGAARSPRQQRLYPLEVSGSVSGGCLRVTLSFAEGVYRLQTLAALVERMAASLRHLAAHAQAPGAGGFTPSDFPGLGLDQVTLDRVLGAGRRVEQVYPLTPLQQGVLFHSLYEEGNGPYLLQWSCTLRGDLDPSLFARAWSEVMERHGILRTAFVWDGLDEPLQIVRREVLAPIERQSWCGLAPVARADRLSGLAASERARGFDLREAPLMRLALVELEPGLHALLWTFHHLLLDGWSLPIVLGEVFAIYSGRRRGQPPSLPPTRPFGDYVAWLRSQDQAPAEAFWRQELAGFTSPTPLPIGPSRATRTAARGEVRLRLSRSITGELHRLAQQARVTVNIVALGAWSLLLARLSGEEEVVFGLTLAGRPAELPGSESMAGLFINTLPLRVPAPVAGGPARWWEELQRRQTRLREFESTPLPDVQRWSAVKGLPLFETVWVFESYPTGPARVAAEAGLEVDGVEISESTNFPLTAVVSPAPEMSLKLLYDGQRIDAVTAGRLLEYLRSLLTATAAATAARWTEMPLLGEGERQQILVEWNATDRTFAQEHVLHRLIERQAAAGPHATALVAGDRRLTYGQLNAHANRLARRLAACGIGPEDRVGVCAERSLGLVIGLLAILKAGGAYLPLDPDLPPARLRVMLESSAAAVVLSQTRHGAALAGYGGRIVELAEEPDANDRSEASDLPCRVLPDNLAYVIYTSGSTGRPKAAMNSHRAICNRLLWMQEAYGLTSGDRVLQKTPFGFDVSVWELFWPLMTGACLVMARPGGHRDTSYLVQEIVGRGITTVHFVPSLLRSFLAEAAVGSCTGLRRVLASGEALPPDLVDDFFHRLPAELHNLYGPTEAAVDVTAWPCDRQEAAAATVPIGRPIANLRIYLLDRLAMPVPIGVAGELCIGGAGLGRGYLADPVLTAGSFVPNPCGDAPGERLYRTGDLARWAVGGVIEFLGRIDTQVKVRGLRIEPGEIEAALCEHPLVRRAVVVARREGDHQRLVGYLEVAPGGAPAHEELCELLANRLPAYMVPSAFVVLAALPLTASGKLDRRALPAPAAERGDREAPFISPSGPAEETMAALWRDVLRLDRVGRDDNFFGLGGDSILALQLVSRAVRRGLRVSLRQLFEHPTLKAVARVAERAGAPAAEQGPVCGPVRLTPIQRWFFVQDLPDRHHFNQALLLQPKVPLDPVRLLRAVASVVAHHDALRLRFTGRGAAAEAYIAATEEHPVFARIDLAGLPSEIADRVLPGLLQRLQASLDLAAGPLLRVASFALGAGSPGRLLLVAHHLVVDAFSWRVLLEDLESAYEQARHGGIARLPVKTTSFQTWAEELWQRSRALAAPEDDAAASTAGPSVADFAPAPSAAANARTLTVCLDAAETRALLEAAPRAYRTRPDEVLLAALALALAEEAGIRPLVLEVESHGRDAAFGDFDLSRTVGWFTLISPLRLEVAPEEGPGSALKRVKERMAAVRRHALDLALARDGAGLAMGGAAEISFNYLGQLDQLAGDLAADRLFALAPEAPGPMRSPRQPRRWLLELNAAVTAGRLEVAWTSDAGRFRPATVDRFAVRFVAELRALIAHCISPGAGGYTPSDFPLAGLGQEEIDRLFHGDPRRVEDVYPLSPLQQGLLFHSLYAPGDGLYCEQLVWSLRGELDLAALQGAWRRIVDHHAVLRTSFLWEGLPKPLQVAWEAAEIAWSVHDWSSLPASQLDKQLAGWLEADRRRGFPLAQPPLARLTWIQLAGDRCHLIWSFHHLLLDGWSLGLVLGEVAETYAGLLRGEEVALQHRPRFHDYIAWLLRQDEGAAEEYWRGALHGFLAPTPLGAELPLSPDAGEEGGFGELETVLPAAAFAALNEVVQRYRVTFAIVLEAAWALLLSRYSGEDEVLFGTTVSGRSPELTGSEEMVGLLINTLPVRLSVPRLGTVGAWWAAVQARQIERLPYEWSSLARIGSWSEVVAAPLFESLVVLENYPRGAGLESRARDLRLEAARMVERPNYPLTLVADPGDDLLLKLLFSTRRFDAAAAARRIGHLSTLLSGFAAGPERQLHELELLTREERRQIEAWGRRPGGAPAATASLGALFAAAVQRDAAAVALVADEQRWTYRQLDQLSNRLAWQLRALGVRQESIVGVCLERSAELVAALLAVLKAGGAYLPLDPALPPERLAFILADSRAELVVGRGSTLGALAFAGRVIDLDLGTAAFAPEAFAADVDPDNLAYVIYTSGSTGRPKGTLVTHANVSRLLASTEPWFGFGPGDVWTLFHSFAFDFSVWEIFGALLYGGRLVVVPYLVSRNPEAFLTLLARERVTVLNQTPSAFHHLARAALRAEGGPAHELELRLVIFGGEALDPRALREWFASFGDRRPRLINMYGITETTVHVTYRPLTAEDASGSARSPIGGPLPDLVLHVLDRENRPVPVGVAGELYVGGPGLARGYLGRSELTAERFVPAPLGRTAGERLYRTGDLARYLPTGDLEYLGRNDEQIKVRGFRIEPGEIEAVLRSHPDITACTVAARREGAEETRLVAYVVAGEPPPTVAELRLRLARRLPDYMVPQAFVFLAALPLTAHGKIDRRALPAPDAARPQLGSAYRPPETPEEEVLATIWGDILGVDRVGADDAFFALGGDSILSLQVVSQARQAGLDVSLQLLFTHPTVRELAAALREGTAAAPAGEPVAAPFALLTAKDRARLDSTIEDAYPLTRLQAGMLFHDELAPDSDLYHDLFSFHLRAPLDVARLEGAFAALAERHPALRTSFRSAGVSEPLQLVHRRVRVRLAVADLRGHSPEAQAQRVKADLEQLRGERFVLDRPPLLRWVLHRRSAEALQLTLSFHHALLDGWSVATLLTELFATYRGEPVRAPLATSQRGLVALELQALAASSPRTFWQEELGRIGKMPRLLCEPRLRETRRQPSRQRDLAIGEEWLGGLERLAEEAGVPLKSVLLAAHVRVLGAVSGRREVITGLVVSARPETDGAERALGLFLNTIPFRQALAGGSWVGLARAVFAAEQRLLPFRRFPLAELQRLHGPRPLFDTLFNFTHFHVYRAVARQPGIEVREVVALERSNFPLVANFSVAAAARQASLRLSSDSGALDATELARLLGYYGTVLTAMAERPGERHERLGVLSAAERHQIHLEWNDNATGVDLGRPVHQIVADQARRRPEALAVADGEAQLTYAELDRQASRLARLLVREGIGPEEVVALFCHRSLELVVAALAVLKAGAAYLPMDPSWPQERLSFVLADGRARVVLSVAELDHRLPTDLHCRRLYVDRGAAAEPTAGEVHGSRLPGAEAPDSLAYVIYTSGSTGLPKGTALRHGGLSNMAAWYAHHYRLTPEDRVSLAAAPGFDAAVSEIWPCLSAGASLHVPPPAVIELPRSWIAWLTAQRITVCFLPTPLAALALAEPWPPESRLRVLVAAGDRLLRRPSPGAPLTLFNSYGPTENTVVATAAVVRAEGEEGLLPPIGRPIANVHAILVGEDLLAVPPGTDGELCLGGASLARGYLGRPDLTAERFLPDPWSGEAGGRLYRTGDLARQRWDGVLEFVGRVDRQAKVRGVRIEPGEVEAALARHPQLRESAVVVREDPSGMGHLVAYFVALTSPGPTSEELRDFLRLWLPAPMLPARFVGLPALPLNANGKIDYAALPTTDPLATTPYVAPRNAVEQLLAALWADLLGRERIGIHDDFFVVGGHSLLATQVMSRISDSLAVELPLRCLFDAPTVAGLAQELSRAGGAEKIAATAEVLLTLSAISEDEAETLLAGGGPAAEARR
ncbi:MAG TPA: non-ribosomal peptide synthase/polyketide synthase [Thermoanaerobaculia bacterium]|nr:non-ribosomal peptide synthase/polyketide synthase [Thermoanaerobaculia bacterium]